MLVAMWVLSAALVVEMSDLMTIMKFFMKLIIIDDDNDDMMIITHLHT